MAIDYLSKWIEAKAFASIKDKDVTQFIWKNIVYRFSIPQSIISNNGPQFDSQVYKNFCNELKIKNLYSTPWYLQSNGQAEASNKTMLNALKKRLDTAKGKWMDELPRVLWANTTNAHRPTGISPFALNYGMEAIILIEIGMPTLRTNMPERFSIRSIIKDLDKADELRKTVVVRVASYHRRLENLYKRCIKPRVFHPGDLV